MHIRKQRVFLFWTFFSYEWRKFDFWGHFHHYKHHKLHHYCYMHNFVYQYCHLGPLGKTRGPPLFSPSHVSDQSNFLLLGGKPQMTRMTEWQGCIFRLTCSHPELTEDHVLTSAYVKIFRTVTRNAVNKSV